MLFLLRCTCWWNRNPDCVRRHRIDVYPGVCPKAYKPLPLFCPGVSKTQPIVIDLSKTKKYAEYKQY